MIKIVSIAARLNPIAGVSTSTNDFALVRDPNTDQVLESIVADKSLNQIVIRSPTGTILQRLDAANGLNGPTALAVADLDGTGEQDLIVADSGGNNILIFRPRLFGMGFGPEIHGGKGIPAGDRPDGLAVADLNGDHVPDLIVADAGSDQVRVFYGRRDSAGWSYTPGPMLNVGSAPSATAVSDINGDGRPDIVVGDAGSKAVTLLRQTADGGFDNSDTVTIDLGQFPGPIMLGPFIPGTGTDLAAVNPRSNSVSMVVNLADPGPALTFSSGGLAPGSLIAAPFLGDGGLDLLVANSGSNNLALFQTGLLGGKGPLLTSLFDTSRFLSRPANLTLTSLTGTSADIFLQSPTGNESIAIQLPLGSLSNDGLSGDGNPSNPFAQFTILAPESSSLLTEPNAFSPAELEPNVLLLPLDDSNLEVVATLTSLALSASTDLKSSSLIPASQPPAQPPLDPRYGSISSIKRIPLAGFPNALNRDGAAAPWTRLIMGLDNAFETQRLVLAEPDRAFVAAATASVDRPAEPTASKVAEPPLVNQVLADLPFEIQPVEPTPNLHLLTPLIETLQSPQSGESLADGVAPLLFTGFLVSNRVLRRRRLLAGRYRRFFRSR